MTKFFSKIKRLCDKKVSTVNKVFIVVIILMWFILPVLYYCGLTIKHPIGSSSANVFGFPNTNFTVFDYIILIPCSLFSGAFITDALANERKKQLILLVFIVLCTIGWTLFCAYFSDNWFRSWYLQSGFYQS